MTTPITCANPTCGKEFSPDKEGRKYCSPECYRQASVGHRPYNNAEPESKECPVCGTVFLVGGRGRPKRSQVYCSSSCQARAQYRTPSQAKTLTERQAAYIAGFIDGEGSIILYRRTYGVAMRITATSTDHAVLKWLADVTGTGSIVQQRRGSQKHSQCWFWQVNADAAASILSQIRDDLIIKQTQADLALEVQGRIRSKTMTKEWGEQALLRMRSLNARGPGED